jgi:hypothetical protein
MRYEIDLRKRIQYAEGKAATTNDNFGHAFYTALAKRLKLQWKQITSVPYLDDTLWIE